MNGVMGINLQVKVCLDVDRKGVWGIVHVLGVVRKRGNGNKFTG